MKILFVVIAIAGIAVGVWQRSEIEDLKSAEAGLVFEAQHRAIAVTLNTKPDSRPVASEEIAVTEDEAARFKHVVISMQADYESDRYNAGDDVRKFSGEMRDILTRLNPGQIRTIITSWRGDGELTDGRRNGIHRFMLSAGIMNPKSTLELMYQLRSEQGETAVPGSAGSAFRSWFQRDKAELLRWAREKGTPEGFGGECATWADATVASLEPTPENVSRFLGHKGYFADIAANEIAGALPDQKSRVTFFQSLHSATGGKSDGLQSFVGSLVNQIPFAQAALIADSVPAFLPSIPERKNYRGEMEGVGRLRFGIARGSRDGTIAQRWDWLVSHPEDRPKGMLLVTLMNAWCEREYRDVAVWARSLPPGTEREEVGKAILNFVKQDQHMRPNSASKNLAAEWEAQ